MPRVSPGHIKAEHLLKKYCRKQNSFTTKHEIPSSERENPALAIRSFNPTLKKRGFKLYKKLFYTNGIICLTTCKKSCMIPVNQRFLITGRLNLNGLNHNPYSVVWPSPNL